MKEFQDYVDSVMSRLDFEFGLLKKWFSRDFPEARIEINLDMNKIKRELQIQCRVLTGKEMTDQVGRENQGSFVNLLRIDETSFMDPQFMNAFISVLNDKYRKEISRAINTHYQNEKSLEERERRLG